MTLLAAMLAQVVHVVLVLLAAPTLVGAQDRMEAWLAGRHGAPLLQPWRDLVRLARKRAVAVESTSAVSRHAPTVCFAAIGGAAFIVPSFTRGMAFAPLSDLLALAGLVAAARTARALAALDAGTAAGGIAAERSTRLALVAEPALLLSMFALAALAGTSNLDLLVALQREGLLQPAAATALAAAALVAVGLAQSLRPDGPRSLTDCLETLFWLDLIGCLFLPIGLAEADGGAAAWLLGLATWVVKLTVLAAALAGCRRLMGSERPRAATDLLAIAGLLALVAAVFAMSGPGPA
jgi:formate hydrogenlyase subunit 4